jgi:hypothetical protein
VKACARPGCESAPRTGQRYCKAHHAEAERGYRARMRAELRRLRRLLAAVKQP